MNNKNSSNKNVKIVQMNKKIKWNLFKYTKIFQMNTKIVYWTKKFLNVCIISVLGQVKKISRLSAAAWMQAKGPSAAPSNSYKHKNNSNETKNILNGLG